MKWIWNVGAAAPKLSTNSFQKSKLCMFCPMPIMSILGRLPVVWAGDTGTIPFKYRTCFCNGTHQYNSTLAKADTSPGAEDGCPMYFVNSWARDGPATSDYWWSIVCVPCDSLYYCLLWQIMLMMYPLFYIITHYYIWYFCLLLHVITMIIITLLLHIFTLLLLVITSIIITCYYGFIITYYYIIITSLLHHYYLIMQSRKFM